MSRISYEKNISSCVIASHSPWVYGPTTRYIPRRLTPNECGKLQGFPIAVWKQVVSDCQARKQFGNAVTVTCVKAIARKLKRFLRSKTVKYTLNDFFCGCGGIGVGFKAAGFEIAGAWDFDKYAVQTYRENVSDKVVQADISKMTIADVPYADVWAFGFPCQDLSVAGKRNGIVLECLRCAEKWEVTYDTYTEENPCPNCGCTQHKAASRSGMFFEIMRLLDEARNTGKLPPILLAENVKGLRPLIPVLEAEYAKRGYKMYYTLYNSKFWGVPQNRERYFVVGVRGDISDKFTFPAEQHDYVPKLSSVLDKDVDEKFYISDDKAKAIIDQALKRLEALGNCHATITPDRIEKRQNGRRAKEDEAEMFTLTAQDIHGVILDPVDHAATPDTSVLRKERTDYAKAVRKDYEAGRLKARRTDMTEYAARPDGISNTLTTVLKDNLLLEKQERNGTKE